MKNLTAVVLALVFLTSCAFIEPKASASGEPEIESTQANAPVNLPEIKPETPPSVLYDLYIEADGISLAKFEPEKGCYTGAYIEEDVLFNGEIEEFEEQIGVSQPLYARYMRLDEEYPYPFVLSCVKNLKTPVLIIEPTENGSWFDEAALLKTAAAIGSVRVPTFVVFYPITEKSRFDVDGYVAFFQKAYEQFSSLAPNAAIIWSIPHYDIQNKNAFYPGDRYTDWIGLSILSEITGGETVYDSIYDKIDYMYYLYQRTKPLFLTVGISHYSTINNTYYTAEAKTALSGLYEKVRLSYPRIKSVLYLDVNYADKNVEKDGNNYLLSEEETLSAAYSSALLPGHFLKELEKPDIVQKASLAIKSPFKAVKFEDKYYIAKNSIEFDFDDREKRKAIGRTHLFDDAEYYDAARILPAMNLDLFEDAENASLYLTRNR